MSGYSVDDLAVKHNVPVSGIDFIEKPVSLETLAPIVRQALDAPAVEWVESLDVEASATAAKSVLVVDDDPSVASALSRMLEVAGMQALTALGPNEALELIRDREVRVDLLVLDILMPGMTGLTVAQIASSLRPGVKVLFISGSVILPGDDPLPDVAWSVRFLSKPVEADVFLATVHEMLNPPASGV